jgi:pimeloyl-ACP methyl ester carboxylesterase
MEKINLNDISIAYERRGRGNTLVLIHGYPLDHSIWKDVLPLLESDFDLIAPDLRGFGQSTTVSTPYLMADLAQDIAGLLDALTIEKAYMAGHSMGGYVALAFAKSFPTRVNGLALVSSQAVADTPERKEGRYKSAADVMEKGVGVVATAMTDKLSANQSVRDIVRPMIERQSIPGVVGALKAMAEREDLNSLLSSFNFPFTLIHGDADELIPVDRAREIKAKIPAANLYELSGAGHLPMMEFPAKTADALRSFK